MITPSAALGSFPDLPDEAMQALRYFMSGSKNRIWGRYGFVDAFSESRDWYGRTYLAINQGPIVVMIENHRQRRERLAQPKRLDTPCKATLR